MTIQSWFRLPKNRMKWSCTLAGCVSANVRTLIEYSLKSPPELKSSLMHSKWSRLFKSVALRYSAVLQVLVLGVGVYRKFKSKGNTEKEFEKQLFIGRTWSRGPISVELPVQWNVYSSAVWHVLLFSEGHTGTCILNTTKQWWKSSGFIWNSGFLVNDTFFLLFFIDECYIFLLFWCVKVAEYGDFHFFFPGGLFPSLIIPFFRHKLM